MPTRVSLKTEKGSDFAYLHPITWAAQSFAYAQLRYGYATPALDLAWLQSKYNTDKSRTMAYFGAKVVGAQSQVPLVDAFVMVYRQDRTLEQITTMYAAAKEALNVMDVKEQLQDGMTESEVAEDLDLTPAQVRAYRDRPFDAAALSPDVQAFLRGEFFFDNDDSQKDGFAFLIAPRNQPLNIIIEKDGYRDFKGTLKAAPGLTSDLGPMQLVMP